MFTTCVVAIDNCRFECKNSPHYLISSFNVSLWWDITSYQPSPSLLRFHYCLYNKQGMENRLFSVTQNKQKETKTGGCWHKSCSATNWMNIKVTMQRDCCGNALQNVWCSVTIPETVSLLSFLCEAEPRGVFVLDGESNELHIDFSTAHFPKNEFSEI